MIRRYFLTCNFIHYTISLLLTRYCGILQTACNVIAAMRMLLSPALNLYTSKPVIAPLISRHIVVCVAMIRIL
jgi:hypothetical protein